MEKKLDMFLLLLQALTGALILLIYLPVIAFWLGIPALAHLAYFLFAPFCHQLPERSFHISGVQLSVCARCMGIYLGIFAGTLFYGVISKVFFSLKAEKGTKVSRTLRNIILIPLLLIVIDGLLNSLGVINSPGWLRFLFGTGFGFMAGWLLGMGVEDLIKLCTDRGVRGKNSACASGVN